MLSALSWQNFLVITDTQSFCSNVATFSSWESCRACYADSVHMGREVAVEAETLLRVCHFLPISLQNSHIHTSAQDTKGFLETPKVLNLNLKVCKCIFRCIVDKCKLRYQCSLFYLLTIHVQMLIWAHWFTFQPLFHHSADITNVSIATRTGLYVQPNRIQPTVATLGSAGPWSWPLSQQQDFPGSPAFTWSYFSCLKKLLNTNYLHSYKWSWSNRQSGLPLSSKLYQTSSTVH